MLKKMLLTGCVVLMASFTMAQAGLLVHYDFEEGSGTAAADAAGGDNTGTFSATPGWSSDAAPVPGGSSYSVQLSTPGSDTLSTPDDDALDALSAYTMALWIKDEPSSSTYAYPRLVFKNDSSDKGYVLHMTPSSSIQLLHDWPSGTTVSHASVADLSGWHHWAVTFDSTAASDNVNLYIDGNPVDSKDYTGVATGNADAFHVISPNGIGNLVDDFRFYNDALSASEVEALVPEPSTVIMLGALLAVSALLWRRK